VLERFKKHFDDDTVYKYTGITKYSLSNGKTLQTGDLGTVRVDLNSDGSVNGRYFHTEDAIWSVHLMDYEEPEVKSKEFTSDAHVTKGTYVLVKSTGHIGTVVGVNARSMLCVSTNNKHSYYDTSELLIYYPSIWEELRYFITGK